MNAAVLASGFARGGADGAREALAAFWRRVSEGRPAEPPEARSSGHPAGRWTLDYSPAFHALDMASRVFSPYDLNPTGWNPLPHILGESIDFEQLAGSPIKVFITATCVRTGRPRIFRNADASADALMASACLPQMFQAIEIDGEAYWDGGYSGNPTISPLVRECSAHDTLLVQINPVERPGTPRGAGEILSRVNEISFNAPC
jgi:NTE family protein